MNCFNLKTLLIVNSSFLIFLSSCSVTKQISTQANTILLKDASISQGHIGVSIYEPATGKYWYEHDAAKYFVPASNTKLFTLYAGMKYLGDSLVGLRYQNFSDTAINIIPAGDPTFLHPDFKDQPALAFLKSQNKKFYLSDYFKDEALGYGWAWDDYNGDYMTERNAFPIYGNTIKIGISGYNYIGPRVARPAWSITPNYFTGFIDSEFVIDLRVAANTRDTNVAKQKVQSFIIKRDRSSNKLEIEQGVSFFKNTEIPMATNGVQTTLEILRHEFDLNIVKGRLVDESLYPGIPSNLEIHSLKTQPTDSLFKPMMHRSDNFFAEQTLLMVSNERLGYMNDEAIIDTLLKRDLADVPQKPKWVDGCGLSRYNLFTPQDFIYILNKIKNEFGMERIKNILATGGTGTIASYYKKDSGYIFAKTGTLSNNCALSGYLYTKKGKLLIFSVLVNNYIGSATPVRRATEKFLEGIREQY